MDEPITDMAQVSPEWLTRVLQKKGFLNQGKVTAVHKQPLRATISLTSRLARFAISYSDDAPTSAPSRVFLKIARPDFNAALSSGMWKNVEYCVQVGTTCQYAADNPTFEADETKRTVTVTAQYIATHTPTVRRRLLKAGVRLGHVLNDIFRATQ